MKKVLFICGHNSGRSQMAQALLTQMGGSGFTVKSAGLHPAETVNPLVVTVMQELGIEMSHHKPKSAFDLFKSGELFTHVITVCDKETDDNCPIYPGIQKRENWPFPDPEKLTGTHEEKLAQLRKIRDAIEKRIVEYFNLIHQIKT
ncbi:MAG TPA: arsenate reductase ArsC [Desulfotignum sp.]|nr:arsenate reductase ArsC [Desulfotignum sp.]